ncbi:MAG: Hpt domain-containing protein, partial [Gammaproteobacteria bacterium]|nr:Hpt domain-containing protein [Gammaproteobacteria bacterium]
MNMLLFHVANSKSEHSRVVELKSDFKLSDGGVRSERANRERLKMSGPDQDAMQTVAGVMREDLSNIKDALDLFVRSSEKDPSVLEELVPNLQQIADTLLLLELEAVSQVVLEQISKINAAIQDQTDLNPVVIDVAGTLLYIDASITSKARFESDEVPDAATMAAEVAFHESRQVIINESRVSLQNAKDAIIEYITNSWQTDFLAEVPEKLTEGVGACRILELHAPADLLDYCAKYIESRIIAEGQVPPENVLDALADVLTSIDYYLEGMQSGADSGLLSVLDAATQSCEVIIAELAKEDTDVEVEQIIHEPSKILKDDKETDESLIDDELIEIFLEEAEEVLETLKEHLPRWIHDTENYEDLTVSRRSFHTLKGSGRMVGAQDIGELAWSIENLLNKVLEGTQKPSEAIFQVVSYTQTILPTLIEDFRQRQAPAIDLSAIQQRAEQLSHGEGDDETWTPPGETSDTLETETPSAEETASIQGDLDPELLEIFRTEAEEHMAACQAYYDEFADSPIHHKPNDSLLRALHTLKGSARMAGIFMVGDTITHVESYFKELKIRNINLSSEAYDLLSDFCLFVNDYISALDELHTEPEEHEQRALLGTKAKSLKAGLDQRANVDEISDNVSSDVSSDVQTDERSPESVQQLLTSANELLMNAEESLQEEMNSEQLKAHSDDLIDTFCRVTDLAENAKESTLKQTADDLVSFAKRLIQVSIPDEATKPIQTALAGG